MIAYSITPRIKILATYTTRCVVNKPGNELIPELWKKGGVIVRQRAQSLGIHEKENQGQIKQPEDN